MIYAAALFCGSSSDMLHVLNFVISQSFILNILTVCHRQAVTLLIGEKSRAIAFWFDISYLFSDSAVPMVSKPITEEVHSFITVSFNCQSECTLCIPNRSVAVKRQSGRVTMARLAEQKST